MKSDFNTILNQINVKGYSVSENFLSPQEVDQILIRFKEFNEKNEFKRAGIGNRDQLQQNASIRGDSIVWLNEKDEFFEKIFFSRLKQLVEELNRSFFLGIRSMEFHLAHYGKNTFYKKHKDVFKSNDARKMSVVCYLNKDWKKEDGGELILYLNNEEQITIAPVAGTLIVFESNLEHEVSLSKNDRYSITGWLKNTSDVL